MLNTDELRSLAAEAGCSEQAEALIRRSEAVIRPGAVKIGITGELNSGKTTLLNAIAGSVLREPSLLSRDEKPLRVSFGETSDDARFDCVLADNDVWRESGVLFFELKSADILTPQKEPAPLLDEMDCIIYTISAQTPFTRHNIEILQLLNKLPVLVVITGMDLLPDAQNAVERIREYAGAHCRKLGLNPPVFTGSDNLGCITEAVRSFIPAAELLEKLRADRAERILQRAAQMVEEQAARKRRETEAEAARQKKAVDAQYRSQSLRQVSLSALAAEIREMANRRREQIYEDKFNAEDIADRVFIQLKRRRYSRRLIAREMPVLMQQELNNSLRAACPDLPENICADLQSIRAKAAEKGVSIDAEKLAPPQCFAFTPASVETVPDLFSIEKRWPMKWHILSFIICGFLGVLPFLLFSSGFTNPVKAALFTFLMILSGLLFPLLILYLIRAIALKTLLKPALTNYVRKNIIFFCFAVRKSIMDCYEAAAAQVNPAAGRISSGHSVVKLKGDENIISSRKIISKTDRSSGKIRLSEVNQ